MVDASDIKVEVKTTHILQGALLLLQKLNEAIPAADPDGYQHNLSLTKTGNIQLMLATAAGGLALEFEPGDSDKSIEELLVMVVDAYAEAMAKRT